MIRSCGWVWPIFTKLKAGLRKPGKPGFAQQADDGSMQESAFAICRRLAKQPTIQ
jgi:hypothetical protein